MGPSLLTVALGLSLSAMPASAHPAPRIATAGSRPVASWPFDEGTGMVVRGKVGGANGVFHHSSRSRSSYGDQRSGQRAR